MCSEHRLTGRLYKEQIPDQQDTTVILRGWTARYFFDIEYSWDKFTYDQHCTKRQINTSKTIPFRQSIDNEHGLMFKQLPG